jgi:hypothetical protein
MELDELEILERKASAGDHSHTVTRAGVRRRAAEVGTAVSTGSKDSVLGQEAVESAVLLVVGDHTAALAILHDQLKGKVLDEVVCVVSEGLAIEGVEQGVSGTIGSSTTPVSLTSLSELLRLTAEGALVTVIYLSALLRGYSVHPRFSHILPSSVLEKGQP